MAPEIAVLYLARVSENESAIQDFLDSYLSHPAGIDHELVIIYKTAGQEEQKLQKIRKHFNHIRHTPIFVDDEGFDIGSYIKAATLIQNKYIFCLNTFSKINSENWLKKLHQNITLPNVGIAGVTGSYESLHNSITFLQKIIWLSCRNDLNFKETKRVFDYYLNFLVKIGLTKKEINKKIRLFLSYIFKKNNSKTTIENLEGEYKKWWEQVKHNGDLPKFLSFPKFPNPHIRSNAFMIERELFLSLKSKPFLIKFDACEFESGFEGMTRQILQKGMLALLVGKDGDSYSLDQWQSSRTFRFGSQANLLVIDNQTRVYDKLSPREKIICEMITWGTDAIKFPYENFNLGIPFEKKEESRLDSIVI